MKKHLFAVGMTAAVLVSGCDAALNAALTSAIQKQQGQSPAPTATAPANTPASTAPGAPAPGGDPFVAGRKWTYGIATKAAGTNIAGDLTIEVADLTADSATIKTTTSIAGVIKTSETKVDRRNPNPWASLNLGASAGSGSKPATTSDETISVGAGTFACTKMTYVTADAQGDGTVDIWLNKDKGLIKEVVTIKPKVAASLPAGFGGFDLSSTTTIELKAVAP